MSWEDESFHPTLGLLAIDKIGKEDAGIAGDALDHPGMPDLIGPHHQGDTTGPRQVASEPVDEVKEVRRLGHGLDRGGVDEEPRRPAGRQELADCLPGGRGFSESDMTFLGGEDRCDFRDWVHEL